MTEADESFGIARTSDQARRLRLALNTLATGSAGPALQDMARDVLSGKVELRAAMQSRAYEEAIGERVEVFSTWYRGLSESQRDAEVERARHAMQDLPEVLAEPSQRQSDTSRSAGQQQSSDDDYFGRTTWLR
jgi:hypothetical protein